MNNDILKGQWRQIRGNVRSSFGKLTDDDLEVVNGDLETLMGKIQERYGYTREQAKSAWDRFTNEMGDRFTDEPMRNTTGYGDRDFNR